MKNLFRFILVVGFCTLLTVNLSAQILTGLSSKWSDEFSEWIIFTDSDYTEGALTMTWRMQNDWSSFDYRLEESIGTIKLKWKANWNEWETRGDGAIITSRTKWGDDPREWRVTNNDIQLELKSKWGNDPNIWLVKTKEYGYFEMFMTYKNDFREWVIIDELSEEISLPMKMTLVLLVMNNSVPKQ